MQDDTPCDADASTAAVAWLDKRPGFLEAVGNLLDSTTELRPGDSFHVPLLRQPVAACVALSSVLGISPAAARGGIQGLLRAGWIVAPREPTNLMLAASVTATKASTNPLRLVNAVAKARLRWKAMALEGSKAAMSDKEAGRSVPAIRAGLYREAAEHLDLVGFSEAAAELRAVVETGADDAG